MNLMLPGESGRGFIHMFFPRLCEGCSKPLAGSEEVLCMGCADMVPETGYHTHEHNETALRFAGRVPFMYATSYAYFTNDGLLQHLVHGLKYNNKKENGYYLGQRFAWSLKKAAWSAEINMIMPVPLHKDKEAKRGYNQSMVIAQGMGRILNITVGENILVRTRDTESQTRKTRAERVKNMEDAFGITDKKALMNKHVLLCDDVLTTGATLEACALAILKEESVKISIATVGIAVS